MGWVGIEAVGGAGQGPGDGRQGISIGSWRSWDLECGLEDNILGWETGIGEIRDFGLSNGGLGVGRKGAETLG